MRAIFRNSHLFLSSRRKGLPCQTSSRRHVLLTTLPIGSRSTAPGSSSRLLTSMERDAYEVEAASHTFVATLTLGAELTLPTGALLWKCQAPGNVI